MSHAFYVNLSYAAAVLVVLALAIWTYLDGKAQQRALRELEAAGIRRRSTARPEEKGQA